MQELNEYCQQHALPNFNFIMTCEGASHKPVWTAHAPAPLEFKESALSKRAAKDQCARHVLAKLKASSSADDLLQLPFVEVKQDAIVLNPPMHAIIARKSQITKIVAMDVEWDMWHENAFVCVQVAEPSGCVYIFTDRDVFLEYAKTVETFVVFAGENDRKFFPELRFVEILSLIPKTKHSASPSLRSLVRCYLKKDLDKTDQCSFRAGVELTSAQKYYAAVDAVATLQVYMALTSSSS